MCPRSRRSRESRFERRFEFPNRDIVEVEGVRPARFEGFDPVDVTVGNFQQVRVKGGRWYLAFRAHFRAPHLPFGERTFALSAGAIQLIVSNQIAFDAADFGSSGCGKASSREE